MMQLQQSAGVVDPDQPTSLLTSLEPIKLSFNRGISGTAGLRHAQSPCQEEVARHRGQQSRDRQARGHELRKMGAHSVLMLAGRQAGMRHTICLHPSRHRARDWNESRSIWSFAMQEVPGWVAVCLSIYLILCGIRSAHNAGPVPKPRQKPRAKCGAMLVACLQICTRIGSSAKILGIGDDCGPLGDRQIVGRKAVMGTSMGELGWSWSLLSQKMCWRKEVTIATRSGKNHQQRESSRRSGVGKGS